MLRLFGATLAWLILIAAAHGDLAGQLAASGDFEPIQAAFKSGKLDEALRQLESRPRDDAPYYYNLGTVSLKMGKLGKATAYLEKANRIQPHDIAIQQNLQLSKSALSQAIGPEKMDPASSWAENLADGLRIDEIRGAFGLVSFVIALFWIRSYLKTRRLRQTLLQPAGWLGVGALAIIAALYGIERLSSMNPVAVCLERTAVRSGPGDTYVELAQAEAGTKLRSLGPTSEQLSLQASPSPSISPAAEASPAPAATPEEWRQIRYSSEGIGWVRSSSVLLL